MKTQLSVGDPAPDFVLPAVGGPYDGQEVSLARLARKNVVLYFYPKDNTPGCTTQACGIRDSWSQLAGRAEIFGVSIDDAKSHCRFIEKYRLPFSLLVDEGHRVAEAFGVWVEKSLYGRVFMGTERSTFVIGPDGRLKAILRKVKPAKHVELLLSALEA